MGVRVQEYVGVAPYAPEALCLYAPIAWELSYTPGPYERGIALIHGDLLLYMRGLALMPLLIHGALPYIRGGLSLICGEKA